MATTIKLKNGSGAPLAGDLVQGEPALDLTNKRLYTEDSGGSVIEVGTNPTSLTTGTFTSTGIDDNATSTAITIDASENVGIGTASPSSLLTLSKVGSPQLDFVDTLGAGNTSTILTAGVNGEAFVFEYPTGGNLRIRTQDNTERMRIDASGNVSVDRGQKIQWYDGTIGSGNVNAAIEGTGDPALKLYTRQSGTSTLTERMRLDALGNVGIGTASPSAKLDVVTAGGFAVGRFNNGTTTASFGVSSDNSAFIEVPESQPLRFLVGGPERMRIDASGNVGIGTTDTGNAGLSVSKANVSNNVYARINGAATANEAGLQFSDQNTLKWTMFKPGSSNDLAFFNHTGGSEAMRIDSSGNLLVGTNSNPAISAGTASKSLVYVNSSGTGISVQSPNSYTGSSITTQSLTSAGTSWYHFVGQSGNGSTITANNIFIYGNGNVVNANNSYGSLSDERLKSNIVDASSQIDDIMAVKVRNYTLNETGDTHIGVVAQELEASGMGGLVEEDGEGMKSVKYSVMYMKAIKALQEAVTRIETLEAEVAALKGA